MVFRKSMGYGQLPAGLKKVVRESDFIKAYDCVESGSLIVWIINHQLGKQQEIEFSMKLSRVLSAEERIRSFPAPADIDVAGVDYKVVQGYRLEPGSDVRYETYNVSTCDLHNHVVTCEQIYYSPALAEVADVVRPAIESALFLAQYRSWSLQEKVNYWVAALYRLRRQAAENLALEDDAFGVSLIGKLRKVDPNIDALLPVILKGLAVMESIAPAELINTFNRKTGLTILP